MRRSIARALVVLGVGMTLYGGARLVRREPTVVVIEPMEVELFHGHRTLSANIETEFPSETDWLGVALLGSGVVLSVAGLVALRRRP